MKKVLTKKTLAWAWLIGCFFVLCVFLDKRVDYIINSDMSSELLLSYLLSKENAIISSNWYYSTEIRVLYSQLVFTPLFKVFSDWHTVRVVGTIILYVIFLSSYYYLCRQLNMRDAFPWSAPFLLLPMSGAYFQFVLVGVFYIPYITISFFLFGLLLQWTKSQGKRVGRIILAFLIGLISVLNGMGGPRFFVVFYFPMLCAVAVLLYLHRSQWLVGHWKKWKNQFWPSFMAIALFATACAACGYLLNVKVLSQAYSFTDFGKIHYTDISLDSIVKILNGWLAALGYQSGQPVFSMATPPNLMSILLTGLAIAALYKGIKHREQYSVEEQSLTQFSLWGFIVFLTVYLFTKKSFSTRYIIPVLIYIVPLLTMGLKKLQWSPKGKAVLCVMIALLMTGDGALIYYKNINGSVRTNKLMKIASFLQAEDYDEGYATFWHANVIIELTDYKIDVRSWCDWDEGKGLPDVDSLYEWLQTKEHFETKPEGKVFILFSSEENDNYAFAQRLDSQAIIYNADDYVIYGYDSYAQLRAVLDGA